MWEDDKIDTVTSAAEVQTSEEDDGFEEGLNDFFADFSDPAVIQEVEESQEDDYFKNTE
jgi:hypothetical protein